MVSDDLSHDTVPGSVHAFGDETTVHGVRYMIARGHFLFRLCWLAIIILAFVLLGIQAVKVYGDYSNSPYATKIDIVRVNVKPFPAVTMCNANRIRRSKLYSTSYEGLIDIDDGQIDDSSETSESEVEVPAEEAAEEIWWRVNGKYDWLGFYSASRADDFSDLIDVVNPSKSELMDYGHQLHQFVLQCTYNQVPCNLSSDFTVWQNRYYGNCFTFNFGTLEAGPVTMTSKIGALNGLHLTLAVEEDEYMGLLSPNRGAKVTIHPLNTLPFPEDEGINVATGRATSIGIRGEVIERLPGFTGCVDENGASTTTNFSDTTTSYTVTYCLKLCFQQSLINRCGCVDGILLDYDHCNVLNATQRTCVLEVQQLYINNELFCNCPLPCRRNLIRLQIYYETLNDEVVEQVPRYTIPNILGNLGGLMGLFTGMSFISIFEITFLLLRVTKISFKSVCFGNRVQSLKA